MTVVPQCVTETLKVSGKLTRQQGWNNCYCLIAQNILLYASELKKLMLFTFIWSFRSYQVCLRLRFCCSVVRQQEMRIWFKVASVVMILTCTVNIALGWEISVSYYLQK